MSGAGFNVRALLRELYEANCPHIEADGIDAMGDPTHYRKYECARCVETMFVRAYALGLGAGRSDGKLDETHLSPQRDAGGSDSDRPGR